jgi:hypothetical protein
MVVCSGQEVSAYEEADLCIEKRLGLAQHHRRIHVRCRAFQLVIWLSLDGDDLDNFCWTVFN